MRGTLTWLFPNNRYDAFQKLCISFHVSVSYPSNKRNETAVQDKQICSRHRTLIIQFCGISETFEY